MCRHSFRKPQSTNETFWSFAGLHFQISRGGISIFFKYVLCLVFQPHKPSCTPLRSALRVAVAAFHPVSETVPLSDTYRFQKKWRLALCFIPLPNIVPFNDVSGRQIYVYSFVVTVSIMPSITSYLYWCQQTPRILKLTLFKNMCGLLLLENVQ